MPAPVMASFHIRAAGEALRASTGLALGFATRPFLGIEVLLSPLYNDLLKLLHMDLQLGLMQVCSFCLHAVVWSCNCHCCSYSSRFPLKMCSIPSTGEQAQQLQVKVGSGAHVLV